MWFRDDGLHADTKSIEKSAANTRLKRRAFILAEHFRTATPEWKHDCKVGVVGVRCFALCVPSMGTL